MPSIREGIAHDGRALFPFMPYPHSRQLCDEDLASIVVYVRSRWPVRNPLPKTEIEYLSRGVPKPLTDPVLPPYLSDPVKRGAHLVNLAGCSDCHTPQVKGQPAAGLDFAGGFILEVQRGGLPAPISHQIRPAFLTTTRPSSSKPFAPHISRHES